MVSLYNMISQASSWSHVTSSIPAVDKLFAGVTRGIFDMQTVPHCDAMYKAIASVMISHLAKSKHNKVIVVNTFNDFPMELVWAHQSSKNWSDSQITVYNIDTVAKLTLFLRRQNKVVSVNTMLVIHNFHDLLDHYKLELSSTYQDILLKVHAQNNLTTIRQQERKEIEGIQPTLMEIPKTSSLLRESPASKFNTHLNFVSNLISQISYNSNMLVFLTGNLDIKYKSSSRPNSMESSPPNSSQMTQTGSVSQLGTQTSFGSISSGKLVLTYANKSVNSNKSILDSMITKRLMFYKDWYHNSPKYRQENGNIPSKQLKQVFCVDFETGPDTLYFDYDDSPSETPFCVVELNGPEESQQTQGEQPRRQLPPSSPNISRNDDSREDSSPIKDTAGPILDMDHLLQTSQAVSQLHSQVPSQIPTQFRPLAQSTSQVQPSQREHLVENLAGTTDHGSMPPPHKIASVSNIEEDPETFESSVIEDSQDMGVPLDKVALDKLRPEFY